MQATALRRGLSPGLGILTLRFTFRGLVFFRSCHRDSRLQSSLADLRADFFDTLLRFIAFDRTGLLTNHIVVVNDGGSIVFCLS